ncbi:MAG: 2OG-Fe(II) oxygenase [Mycobacteriales bacterium]
MALAAAHSAGYESARPFPHVVLDEVFPANILDTVASEFPEESRGEWWRFDAPRERKLALHQDHLMGPTTRAVFRELNSATMLDFLEALTGISGLVPDPHLYGGGLHQVPAGGHLAVHADFNLHPRTKLQRRVNLIVYLNRDWPDSYGGALELWEADLSGAARRIPPLFGRCVIFSISDQAFHGHPQPLCCPPGRARRSLAVYYYTTAEPEVQEHNTLFPDDPPAGPTVSRLRRAWRRAVPESTRMLFKSVVNR